MKPVDPKSAVVVYRVRHRIALGAEHCGAGLNGYHAHGIISIDAGELIFLQLNFIFDSLTGRLNARSVYWSLLGGLEDDAVRDTNRLPGSHF